MQRYLDLIRYFTHLDPVVLTVDVLSSQKRDLYGFKPTTDKCVRKWVPCGDELTRTQQIATLASLSLVLINNATHLYAKREISEPGTMRLNKNIPGRHMCYFNLPLFFFSLNFKAIVNDDS